jgi:hypothetical protein
MSIQEPGRALRLGRALVGHGRAWSGWQHCVSTSAAAGVVPTEIRLQKVDKVRDPLAEQQDRWRAGQVA